MSCSDKIPPRSNNGCGEIQGRFRLEDCYGRCLYQVQYTDDDKAWTVPVTLNKLRAERFLNDFSVVKVKLIFTGGPTLELILR
jgi:hypothetical protein